jgi:HD-GYP domain-containing protein (c-di-GMP phosphodiesterase class II)
LALKHKAIEDKQIVAEQQRDSRLRQAEIIMALSLATDLGTGRPMEWAMRSALLGVRLGAALGLNEEDLRAVYYCALLLYVGCTAEIELALQMFGDDPASAIASVDLVDQGDPQAMMAWMSAHFGAGVPAEQRPDFLNNAGKVIALYKTGHCEVAQQIAKRLGLETTIQLALTQMGEKWNGEGVPHGLQGEAIALPMRVALLVRDLEPWLNRHGIEAAVSVARQRAGGVHDPHIADQFCQRAHQLCASLEQDANWHYLLKIEPLSRPFSETEFDEAMMVFADFIDLLSPYLVGHSRRVAALAESAARHCGLSEESVKALWRAALAHDIGKIAVPHGLWSAHRPLSDSEWERVRLHPYYTGRILARPDALARLGTLATAHHEYLDGSGYHRNLRADVLSPGMRLLAAANFYCARREARPNRSSLPAEELEAAMRVEIRAGRLDGEAVKGVLAAAGHHTTPVRRDYVAGLTEREIDVLRLIARGYSNRQMAENLGVSEKTIGTHVMHIYDKIGCSTRSAATLFALQHHLIGG